MPDNNQERLLRVFADVLQADASTLNDDSSPDTIQSWDSLAVVNLVMELEQEFGVEFDILEIADFRTVGIVKGILGEKGVVF